MKRLLLAILSFAFIFPIFPGNALAISESSCISNHLCHCAGSAPSGAVEQFSTTATTINNCISLCKSISDTKQATSMTYTLQCKDATGTLFVPDGGSGSAQSYVEQAINAIPDVEGVVPNLNVPIPGLDLEGSITKSNGIIRSNLLSRYIDGVYRYLLIFASVMAVVMLMVGGLEYTVSAGSAKRVDKAKKRITNAIIGLVLLFAAFDMAYLLDPNTTAFRTLNIRDIEGIQLEALSNTMYTAEADTSAGTGGATAGSHTSAFPTCPIALTAPRESTKKKSSEEVAAFARNQEFFAKIPAAITGVTAGEKMTQIADAAIACDVDLGSCGNTVGTIALLAGVGSASCGNNPAAGSKIGDCSYERLMSKANALTLEQIKGFSGNLCNRTWCKEEYDDYVPNDADCTTSKTEAISRASKDLVEELKDSDYPDSWVKDLQPGDALWIYNGNPTCSGLHSLIFAGWGTGGNAQVLQGSAGGATNAGSYCITSECGASMVPVVKVFKPR